MSKQAFEKTAEGLTEALAVAKGEVEPAKVHTRPVMTAQEFEDETQLDPAKYGYA